MARHFGGSGRALASYRGSRKKLRKLRMSENFTPAVWGLLVLALLILFVAIPWMTRNPPPHPHHVFGQTEKQHE